MEVFYSEDDSGYIAVGKDLPGCSAFGKTPADAVTQIQSAISAWRPAAADAGNPIPEPSRPTDEPAALPSGKILLRLPRTLHGSLIERAEYEEVSLNQYLVYLLSYRAAASQMEQIPALISQARFLFPPDFCAPGFSRTTASRCLPMGMSRNGNSRR